MGLEGYMFGYIVSLPVRLALGIFHYFLSIPVLTDAIGLVAIAAVVLIVTRGKKGD